MKPAAPDNCNGVTPLRVLFALLLCGLLPLLAFATAPAWWTERGVTLANASPDDYATANHGQLKNIAKAAVAEMDAKLSGGAGQQLHDLIAGWSNPTAQTNDFAPLNLGQLKNVAKLFYDRLIAAGLGTAYPWASSVEPADDFAAANIGQVKNLFSFEIAAANTIDDPLADRLAASQRAGNLALEPQAVWVWGNRFGGNITSESAYPKLLTGLPALRSVSLGDEYAAALAADGTVLTWGKNRSGQLGDGTTIDRTTPLPVANVVNVISVKAGGAHVLALQQDGAIVAWGDNYYGQLGSGDLTPSSIPVPVIGLTDVRKIAAGPSRSVALKNDGTVWTWGYEHYDSQTGQDVFNPIPTQVADFADVVDIAVGYEHVVAVKADGSVWAWGSNYSNQIGNGNFWWQYQATPFHVPNLANVVKVASNSDHSLALLNDGTVWAWGVNNFGQLGDGTTQPRQAPVQVSGLTNVVALATSYSYSMAMKADGTVWAWGDGAAGILPGADLHVPQPLVFGLLDTNANGIDDRWEYYYFGDLIHTGNDDSDGDGVSNLAEFYAHSDPTDYYNGVVPSLEKVSGDDQVAGSGVLLASPLVVRVTNSQGQPLANAPLTFFGWGAFSPDGDTISLVDWSLTVRSDASGLARVYYQTPLADDVEVESIAVQAQSGSNITTTEFTATTDPVRYYDSITPVLTIVSGANQNGVPGSYTFAPLVVEVRDAAGNLLVNAPVTFSVTGGSGSFSLSRDANASGSAILMARTNASGQVIAYYMPGAGDSSTQITIAPTGAASGNSVTASARPLDPNGDEDEDGKSNGDETKLGTNPQVFNLFSEQHYGGYANAAHTASDPLPWTFYAETLLDTPPAWQDLTVKAFVAFDSVGGPFNWVVDDFASLNNHEFVRLGQELVYDISAFWNRQGPNTFSATSDIRGNIFCAAFKAVLSVELPVDIVPDTGQANLGGLVPSNLGVNGYDHFVSPPNLADNPNYDPAGDYVTFVASGVTAEQFSRLLKWDPAFGEDVSGAPNKRRVKRDIARDNILRVLTQDGDKEVVRLNVWIASANISVASFNAPYDAPDLRGTGAAADVTFGHVITPAEIISAADHPALDDVVVNGAPGGPIVCETDPSKGANRLWDVSRQVYVSVSSNRGFPADIGCAASNFTAFPSDNVLGNDDGNIRNEINDPYSHNGRLEDNDSPSSVVHTFDGAVGDWINWSHHFREFTRLRINGIWYRITPFYTYQLDLKFNKTSNGWIRDATASRWTFP